MPTIAEVIAQIEAALPEDQKGLAGALTAGIQELASSAAAAASRVAELEPFQTRASEHEKAAKDASDALQALRVDAVSRMRRVLSGGHAELEKLIVGDTLEAVEASAAVVHKIIDERVKQVAASPLPVPAGGGGRILPDTSNLSPREKIKAGLAPAV